MFIFLVAANLLGKSMPMQYGCLKMDFLAYNTHTMGLNYAIMA
jgi:hypothetical protein